MRGVGLFCEHELKVLSERGFDGGDVLIGNADFVGERAQHVLGGLQHGQGAGAKAFVSFFELFEHAEAGPRFGLLTEKAVEFLRGLIDLLLQFAETLLAFFDRAAACLHAELFGLHIRGELGQPGFETDAFLLELNFLRRQFFQSNHVALLLEIEGIDLVANAGE